MSRSKIIDASVKLFSELGYHRTSMDDIAKEAQVAKGTLYYHFSGKGELFETIVTDGIQMLMDSTRQALQEEQAADRQIRRIVRRHVELFLEYSAMVHIIFNEITNGIEPDILGRIESLKQRYIQYLSELLTQGHEEGTINPLHGELAAAGLLGLLESATMYAVKRQDRISAEQLHETVDALVLPALLR